MTASGIVTDVSPEHSKNADSPILVTVFGMVIEVRPENPLKALSPISVTVYTDPVSPTLTLDGIQILNL